MVSQILQPLECFSLKTLPVGVVQFSITAAGHHPHDLHMHIRQSCRTGHRGQKQAGVSLRTAGLGVFSIAPFAVSWVCSGCRLG